MASRNYDRRRLQGVTQSYDEVLTVQDSEIITDHQAKGPSVTSPKIVINSGVKLLDFDSLERRVVLALDTWYDLILRMSCLEHHEPYIDESSDTFGATRTISNVSM